MPMAPRRGCAEAGCPARAQDGSRWCAEHAAVHTRQSRREQNRRQWRETAAARGYDHAWSAARKAHIRREPLCRRHAQYDYDVAVEVVHHYRDAEHYPEERLKDDNLIGVCRRCHEWIHGRGADPINDSTDARGAWYVA